MRRSEALELKWTDIDFESGFIHVRKSKNGSARKVPLEEESIYALSLIQKSDGYVFKNSDGERYHQDSFLKPLKKAAIKAGIQKRIDIHSLRHGWDSNKIRAGWGLKKVSLILGHSDISITSEVYTHLLDGDLKVRDDFRFGFDKNLTSANSRELEGSEKDTMAKIVGEFIHKLQDMPMEALLCPEFAQSIQSVILREVQSNAAKQQEIAMLAGNGSHDPYMTRAQELGQKIDSLLNQSGIEEQEEKTNKKAGLAFASPAIYGGPDRVRTCDLQIRSLTL